jgi:hypothetical protein
VDIAIEGLPVRGQRTKTQQAAPVRASRKTVAGKKKAPRNKISDEPVSFQL